MFMFTPLRAKTKLQRMHREKPRIFYYLKESLYQREYGSLDAKCKTLHLLIVLRDFTVNFLFSDYFVQPAWVCPIK